MPKPEGRKKKPLRHNPLHVQMEEQELKRDGPLRAQKKQPKALVGAAGGGDDTDVSASAGAAAAAAAAGAAAGAAGGLFAGLNPHNNPAMRATTNPPILPPPRAVAVKPPKRSKAEVAADAAAAAAAAPARGGKGAAKGNGKARVPNRLVTNTRDIADDDDDDDDDTDMGAAAAGGSSSGAAAAAARAAAAAAAAFGDDDDDGGDSDDDDGTAKAKTSIIRPKQAGHIMNAAQQQLQAEAAELQGAKLDELAGASKVAAFAASKGVEDDDEDAAKIDAADVDGDDGDADPTDVALSAEDQKDLEMYYPAATKERRTLADMIMDKLKDSEKRLGTAGAGVGQAAGGAPGSSSSSASLDASKAIEYVAKKMDPQIVEVYSSVGKYLHHYTSGKVPLAFRVIPTLKNWEEVLFLTTPDNWTAQSCYAATKVFASNLNPKMAQRFYNLVLLPKVRSDITAHKKLNFHLYQSLKKSIYKPAAFFRGILLPLCEEGASVREAVIFSSLLTKCSIPVLHTSVAILKLTQMPYSGTSTLILKTLINKKYNLPNKVIENLVRYFVAFIKDEREMPVIWHQNLLTFVQRYKHDLTAKHKAAIHHLITIQKHRVMSPEIDRELRAQEPTVDLTKPAHKSGAAPFGGAAAAAAPFGAPFGAAAAGAGAGRAVGLTFVANTRPGQAGAARMDV